MPKSLDGAIVVEDLYTFKLVSVIWLCFVILGTALILVGTFGLPLMTGRFDTYRTEEIFFKQHCKWDGQVESCTSAGSLPDNQLWAPAYMLMLISVAIMVFVVGAIMFALCMNPGYIDLAKTVSSIAHTFLILAWFLIAIGIGKLGDPCELGKTQCGVECFTGAENAFSPFYVCDPWSIGAGMWALFAGTAILFFSSFLTFAIKLKKMPDAPPPVIMSTPASPQSYVVGPGGAIYQRGPSRVSQRETSA